MKNRDIYWRYKIQKTLYIGQWCLCPLQGRHLETSHNFPNSSSVCCSSRSFRTNFATTCFMPRSWVQISNTIVFRICIWASNSLTVSCWSLLIAACPFQHCQVFYLFQAFQNEDHFQQIFNHLWSICTTHIFIWDALTALSLKAFWIIQIVSTEECSSLMQNLMQMFCSTQSFWMWQLHSTHVHSMTSTAPTD